MSDPQGTITKQDLIDMEQRLEGKIDASADRVRTELTRYIDQRSEKVETTLLKSFHGWSRSMEIRVRQFSPTVAALDERLAIAEERIGELERGK